MSVQGPTVLWRCRECGKWSHARRRPTHHVRLIKGITGSELPEDRTRADAAQQASGWELPIVEYYEERSGTTYARIEGEDEAMEPVDDWYVPPAVTVKCGPFVEFHATLVRPWHEDPVAREHARRLSIESMDNGEPIARRAEPTAVSAEEEIPF